MKILSEKGNNDVELLKKSSLKEKLEALFLDFNFWEVPTNAEQGFVTMLQLSLERVKEVQKSIQDDSSCLFEVKDQALSKKLEGDRSYLEELIAILYSNPPTPLGKKVLYEELLRFLEDTEEKSEIQLLQFLIYIRQSKVFLEKDHDYVVVQNILKQVEEVQEKLIQTETKVPSYLSGPYVFNSLEVLRRLDGAEAKKKAEGLLDDVLKGKMNIPHLKKLEFLIELTKFLPRESAHDILGACLYIYYSVQEREKSNFIDVSLTRFLADLNEKEFSEQSEFVVRAEREWLQTFSEDEKKGEEYTQQRDCLFQNWKQKGKLDTHKASVLLQEGFDMHDHQTVLEAINIIKESGDDFFVAEAELKRVIFFNCSKGEKERILLRSWRMIEKHVGQDVIDVFLENEKTVPEEIIRKVKNILGDSNSLLGQEFHRIDGIPTYINDIAQLIVDIYERKKGNNLQAFREAYKEYKKETLQQLNRSAVVLEREEDKIQKIKSLFQLEEVSIIPFADVPKDVVFDDTFQVVRQKYMLEKAQTGEPVYWRGITYILLQNSLVLVLKNKQERKISPQEIKVIVKALVGEGVDIKERGVQELFIPHVWKTQEISDKYLSQEIRNRINELYVHGLAIPPSFGHQNPPSFGHQNPPSSDRPNPQKTWGLVFAEEDYLVGAGSITSPNSSSIPLIYAGFPNDWSMIQKYFQEKFNVNIEECAVTGDLAIDPIIKDHVFLQLLQICSMGSLTHGYKWNLMIGHMKVVELLTHLIGRENFHIVDTREEEFRLPPSKIKNRLISEHDMNSKMIDIPFGIYTHPNSKILLISTEQLGKSLKTK